MSPHICYLMSMIPSTHVVMKTILEIIISHHTRRTCYPPKTTFKTTMSQNLISKTSMLSLVTFFCPTWHQPKQQLQLQYYKMQCPRNFFMGFTCHSTLMTNFTWIWPSWHWQPIICLHGSYISSMCPSLETIDNHVSCDVT